MALFGFSQVIPSLITGIGGAALTAQGRSMQVSGANQAASAYRMAGVASLEAANYNVELEKLNLQRNLDASSRQFSRFMSTQRTEAASTGFLSGSKSFLQVVDTTLSVFERQLVDTRSASKQAAETILFEGRAAQVEFENRAQAALASV